jgi:hypothetical protein
METKTLSGALVHTALVKSLESDVVPVNYRDIIPSGH